MKKLILIALAFPLMGAGCCVVSEEYECVETEYIKQVRECFDSGGRANITKNMGEVFCEIANP